MSVTTDERMEELADQLGVSLADIRALGKRRSDHPEWCPHSRDCADKNSLNRVHVSPPITQTVPAPGRFGDTDSGEEVTVEVRWMRFDSAPSDPPPAFALAMEVIMRNPAYADEFQVTGGPEHIRKIAAVLVAEANRMERST